MRAGALKADPRGRLPRLPVVTWCLLMVSACAQQAGPPPPPTLPAGIFAMSYQGIYDSPVTLDDGRYAGPPFLSGAASRPTLELLPTLFARAEREDGSVYLVVLSESSGGSGSFRYLAAVLERQGALVNTSTVLLGDRVDVEEIRIDGNRVTVRQLEAGNSGALCCPDEPVLRRWLLEDGQLEPVRHIAGGVVYGHESRTLAPCGGEGPYWLLDAAAGAVRRAYEAFAAEPYQEVFMVLNGVLEPPGPGEFAADFPAQLRAVSVRRVEGEGFGCDLDLGGARFRALGVEPFWRLDLYHDRLALSMAGTEVREFVVQRAAKGPPEHLTALAADGGRLRVEISEAGCVDAMSGARFAYRVRLTQGARTLAGCGLEPLPRD